MIRQQVDIFKDADADVTEYVTIPAGLNKAHIVDAYATITTAGGSTSTTAKLTLKSGNTTLATITFGASASAGSVAHAVLNETNNAWRTMISSTSPLTIVAGSGSGSGGTDGKYHLSILWDENAD